MCKPILFLIVMILQFTILVDAVSAEQRSSPAQLIEKAGEMFPDEIASQVQEQISLELEQALLGNGVERQPKSIATLFLADRFYRGLDTGKFEGDLTVVWNGFDSSTEEPTFVFRETGFAYTSSSNRKIVPKTMNTDGGSIPKFLHSIGKFTPWGYGPAYIIHDWLFVGHKCGDASVNDIDFEMSAILLAEAIKTLMEVGYVDVDGQTQKFSKQEDTLYLIYQAVSSNFARRLWDDTSSVTCR